MHYWVVMPAAGAGRRFGAELPKQYAPLAGRSVIEWALQPFLQDSRCAGIAVALASGDSHWARLGLASLPGTVRTTTGGAQRADSVLCALAALPAEAGDWVLVHDAVRPCLSAAEIERLVTRVAGHAVGGLLAVPLADTLKRAGADGCVVQTLPRQGLWRALTPQMFRYGTLCGALRQAQQGRSDPTDEAQAIEAMGLRPVLVEGSVQNLKVTTPADLALAEAVLRAREQGT